MTTVTAAEQIAIRDEDVFVVTMLDRLARSVVDLAAIVQKLKFRTPIRAFAWRKIQKIPRVVQ